VAAPRGLGPGGIAGPPAVAVQKGLAPSCAVEAPKDSAGASAAHRSQREAPQTVAGGLGDAAAVAADAVAAQPPCAGQEGSSAAVKNRWMDASIQYVVVG